LARNAEFDGLFAVVSDPVDLLCQRVYAVSNCNADGIWDAKGLRPEQVQGYGLGVMNSRAAYYAKQDTRFTQFLTEGRAYGPHGSKLVIADSVASYHHELSMELTQKTVQANLEVRALGFKPYIAPALSSAAISILLTLRGEWHYSANYLGGIYMGCKNRSTRYGVELEHLPLPALLLERIQEAQQELKSFQV
ncbi:MAG: lactate dehydrogenase, partial [Peptococcaceae bacterium]|nr:lactate dehydrogenase [Peptococcaceae bacterium]